MSVNIPLTGMSTDEKQRITQHGPQPFKRYHYRYIAADLAWEAAELMEDNTDYLAKYLCEAGGWIKANDPLAADRYYKALVVRCPDTPLGREAGRKRWFPAQCE